jgi:hypothetical protein
MSDKAFFYVAIAHAASDCDLSLRKGDPIDAVSYRTEAIKIINERLGTPQYRISDENISAVAALANYEASMSRP